jgi:nitroreductase
MDFIELLDSTRTYHSFESSDISDDLVHKMIENALKAPNHKFTFPWHFIHLKGEKKIALADMFVESKKDKIDLELGRDEEFFKSKILNPEILVLGQKLAQSDFTQKEDYATLSCSVQLMALYLRENGLGYKWSTGGFTRDEDFYSLLEINPSDIELVGVLMFGKTKGKLAQRRRPTVQDVLKTTA